MAHTRAGETKILTRAQELIAQTEEILERWKHPDPYRPPTAPGGSKYERNLPVHTTERESYYHRSHLTMLTRSSTTTYAFVERTQDGTGVWLYIGRQKTFQPVHMSLYVYLYNFMSTNVSSYPREITLQRQPQSLCSIIVELAREELTS